MFVSNVYDASRAIWLTTDGVADVPFALTPLGMELAVRAAPLAQTLAGSVSGAFIDLLYLPPISVQQPELPSDPFIIYLARFRAGDSHVFSALHATWSPGLAQIARKFGLVSEEVEDAIQDTWVRVFEQRLRWRGDGNLGGWLARICRSVCVNRIRSRQADRLTTVSEERLHACIVVGLSDDVIDDGLRSQAFGDWIDDQIKTFPTSQRNAAALRWLLRWPVLKIAQTLEVTPGTVKTELFRARRVIARRLKDPQVVAALRIDQHLLERYVTVDD